MCDYVAKRIMKYCGTWISHGTDRQECRAESSRYGNSEFKLPRSVHSDPPKESVSINRIKAVIGEARVTFCMSNRMYYSRILFRHKFCRELKVKDRAQNVGKMLHSTGL